MYDEDVRSESFREHLSPEQRAELEIRERQLSDELQASSSVLRLVGRGRERSLRGQRVD